MEASKVWTVPDDVTKDYDSPYPTLKKLKANELVQLGNDVVFMEL